MARLATREEFAQYGNTVLQREYCSDCETYAIVLDGELQCCGKSVRKHKGPAVITGQCEAEARRKPLRKREKEKILASQDNRCIYCDLPFGAIVTRGSEEEIIFPNWDHLIPYVYSHDSHAENYVAACQICNAIKHDALFPTIEKARNAIKKRRAEKGWVWTGEVIGKVKEAPVS